jgi:hypothetical protein
MDQDRWSWPSAGNEWGCLLDLHFCF